MVVEVNPLAAIKPTYQSTGVGKSLRDLQGSTALEQLKQSGALGLADKNNSAARALEMIKNNLDPRLGPEELGSALTLRRGLEDALTGGKAIDSAASGGVRILGKTPFNLPDTAKQKVTPGQLLKGEAEATAAAKVVAERGQKGEVKHVTDSQGNPVGDLQQRTDTSTQNLKTEEKNTPLAKEISNEMIQYVTNYIRTQRPNAQIGSVKQTPKGNFIVELDGVEQIVRNLSAGQ